MSILVSSPSSYRDVFDISADLFIKNWPKCPYAKIYATDNMESKIYKGFEVISFPDKNDWISRTRSAIKHIDSKYVMVITDDAFLVRNVKNGDFMNLLQFMKEKGYMYCRIYHSSNIKSGRSKIQDRYYNIKYNNPYGRNLFASIWEKTFFEKFLSEAGNDAWHIEEQWLKEAISKQNDIIEKHIYFHNNYFYHSVYKGLWLRNARKIVLNQGVPFLSERKQISIRQNIILSLKSFFGKFLNPTSRLKIKKFLSKFIHFDTKY